MQVTEKGIDNMYAVVLSTDKCDDLNKNMSAKRWLKYKPLVSNHARVIYI